MIDDKRQIPYTEWEETVNPFLEHRTFDSWVACVGSSPIYRGYSCGLWSLFHLLLTEAHLQKASDAKLVPFVIRDYVLEVFSCRSCSDNFRREVKEFQIEKNDLNMTQNLPDRGKVCWPNCAQGHVFGLFSMFLNFISQTFVWCARVSILPRAHLLLSYG